MKLSDLTKYISVFILAVLIIAVYKTFDSIGVIFEYLKGILKLFTPIFCAFAIAFILYPLCVKFESFFAERKIEFLRKHRRGISVLVIYILFVLVIAAFISIMFPAIVRSITEFIVQMPVILQNVKKYLRSLNIGGYKFESFIQRISVTNILEKFNLDDVQMYINRVAGFSKIILAFVMSVIISVYILIDRTGLISTARKLGELVFPEKSRPVIMKYINRTFNIMYKYIYCQFSDAFIVFVLSFVLLFVMRVQYAPVLAVFLGVFNLIPYFGAITACAVTAVLTVFTSSLSKGIWVAVMLIILQQVDANVIQPKLVRGVLQVKPFWVLCGISVGGGIFGITGIILAVPAMALVKTIFDDYFDYIESKKAVSEKNNNT